MKKNKMLSFLLILVLESFLLSCSKEKESSSSGTTPFELRMTDAIASYDAVNIDVTGVEVKTDNGTTVMMNVNAGVYNLLHFANGQDTLIAVATIPTSTVSQVRLIL